MTFTRRILAHRGVPWVGAALALLLTLPALDNGWHFDDLPQRLVLLRHPEARVPPEDMFAFTRGDPRVNHEFKNMGTLPWWTDPRLRIALWRPVSVWAHRLDYRLWPDSGSLMHLHSLIWLATLVLCAGLLYRRVIGGVWIAGLAALLFAVDEAHGFPAGWLANRNALVATTFGLLALLSHDRWCRGNWRPGCWLGPGLFAASLLAGEFALGAGAYLLAHTLFLDPDRGPKRLARLLPYGLVIGVWASIYAASGYGTSGSGVYIHPIGDPLRFLRAIVERGPVLLLGQWAIPHADTYSQAAGPAALKLWLLALVVTGWVCLALAPLLRRDATARFWGAGMALSVVPVCATFPSNRLLFFVGLGGMALAAQFLGGLLDTAAWVPSRRPWQWPARLLAGILIPIHMLLAPIQLPVGAMLPKLLGAPVKVAMESISSDSLLRKQDLVIVNAPDHLFYVSNIGVLRLLEELPLPRHLRGLVTAPVPIRLTRIDGRTLRADIREGMLRGTVGELFRGSEMPLRIGDRIELDGLSVEVIAVTPDHGPSSVLFRFTPVLEDSSLRWVQWRDGVFGPFSPPPVGQTVELPAARGVLELTDMGQIIRTYRWAQTRLGVERTGTRTP